jgi:hypothetical protein
MPQVPAHRHFNQFAVPLVVLDLFPATLTRLPATTGASMTLLRLTLAAAFGVLLLACSPATQSPAPEASTTTPPDLSGVWMAFAVENPDGGGNTPKYSPEGIARLDAFAAQFRSIPETGKWCLGTGMPGVMMSLVSYPVQIVQTPKLLVMLAELEMQLRRVHLDGRPHGEDLLPSSSGHSTGSWDGDTLVIDTALLSEWNIRPWPRSDQAHVTERIRLTKLGDIDARPSGFIGDMKPLNDDVLVIDLTFTDPAYYAGPQRRTIYHQRMDDTVTLEYLCATEHWLEQLDSQRLAAEGPRTP